MRQTMRAIRSAFLLFALGGFLPTVAALAQPPAHGRPAPPQALAKSPGSSANRSPLCSAPAAAYMSGKQPLVGLHAPSERNVARDADGRAMLVLLTVNRGESLAIRAFGDEGGFDSVDLDHVAHLLRAATGDEHPIDARTLALVYRIQVHFGVAEVRVVSGYRIPKAGSRSNHGKGRALDLVVPGVTDIDVATFARDMGFTGVGVYPASQFVHVDIRPRSYFWVDYSGPRMKNRESGILDDLAAKSDAAALARGQSPIEPFVIATDVDEALRARGVVTRVAQPDEDEDEEN